MDVPNSAASSSTLVITAEDVGERLDRLIVRRLPELSRSRVKGLIEEGCVSAGGATITSPSAKVKLGQSLIVAIPAAIAATPEPQAMDLAIVYEDDYLLVLDKPAGLVVHPAAGNLDSTLVNALLAHCGDSLSGIGGVKRPGIVHRLDKDTSGLMVIAKTEPVHVALATAFAERTIERAYHAAVWGVPSPREGIVDAPIGRSSANRQKMAVVANGKSAITRYKVIKPLGLSASLVECRLQTGRTHQIRVHMTHLSHPLIGDPAYGRTRASKMKAMTAEAEAYVKGFSRQALHAVLLGFKHPATGQHLRFTSQYPDDLARLICFLEAI